MILAALILQAAAPQSAVDAERAFAAAAQAKGQWTAFRETAAPDAVMFQPGPVKALDWMKGKADPPKAVEWWPTESYVSCDGTLAVNTGGWKRPNGTVGYFTTVWQRQADGGWKWVMDHGDVTNAPREKPLEPKIVRAVCGGIYVPSGNNDRISKVGSGLSKDTSLIWKWTVRADGSRDFSANIWNGNGMTQVVHDVVAAETP
ncbi:hypothetical protein HZY97_17345 [Sphingomonas sp. R-74633]|uniref:YybH family protein n=1 Tax=Sphingomonas sp. R-74633 TaxID=2751188 RepID=UPI0015D31185|nr:hypothetical protein [Sphingomonas sp. R-74633]NYT42541.1 hypothetical protein [Sphingomonas sp. R-74633]